MKTVKNEVVYSNKVVCNRRFICGYPSCGAAIPHKPSDVVDVIGVRKLCNTFYRRCDEGELDNVRCIPVEET